MDNFISQNKFSNLHDGKNIFFTKIEFINQDFKTISNLKNDVILITGNSDKSVDENLFNMKPKNVKKWYANNATFKHDDLIPLPIGLENTHTCKRDGHGVVWNHAFEKVKILSRVDKNQKINSGKIFSNFNINTNITFRSKVKRLSIELPYITWKEPNLSYNELISDMINHGSSLCPIGNGIDTHRVYESLYCGVTPIVFSIQDSPIFTKLYTKLPILILDSPEDLQNKDLIMEKLNNIKFADFDMDIIYYDYWEKHILNNLS